MGFVEAIKSFYRRYFDFETRSTRSEYWWVYLFQTIVTLILIIPIIIGAVMAEGGSENAGGVFILLGFVPLIIFMLANIIPQIAVSVRRFHDQDKSGWMYLLSFIPYVGIIVIIVFMILEGTRGPNRFGPNPLDPGHGGTFD